jgi:sugar phosphate isomerase/epimerase
VPRCQRRTHATKNKDIEVMVAVSYQLYSSRNFPDLARQCAMLAGIGYRNVEPFGGLFNDIDALEKALKDNGLAAPTAHIGLQMLRDDFAGACAKLKRIGVTTPLVPAIPQDERVKPREGWAALGAELADFAHRFADLGMRFGWHNHAFEFARLPDGSYPLELILGNEALLKWEVDIAWVVRGAQDPKLWIERYADRIIAFHAKDLAPAGTLLDEDGWADAGTGTIDFARLMPAMKATPAEFYVCEHDNPKDDARFAARAFANVSKW